MKDVDLLYLAGDILSKTAFCEVYELFLVKNVTISAFKEEDVG